VLRRTPLLAAALAAGLGSAALGATDGTPKASTPYETVQRLGQKAGTMKIRLRIGESVHTATLADGAAARDFASLLPLTLPLRDYASTEKIADLPRRLAIAGAPDGYDPSPGDITYYAPWGNLAIFYRDFGYSRGLVHLGTMSAPAEALRTPGPVEVTIERVE
jgi:hypothetical protein